VLRKVGSEVGGQRSEVRSQRSEVGSRKSEVRGRKSEVIIKAMGKCSPEADESVLSETLDEIKEPSMYRVLIHNDDYTSMEFVVETLVSVFNKSLEDAINIMLKVHREEIGLCGVYIYDIAETKVGIVETLARGNGFPLKCSMERD